MRRWPIRGSCTLWRPPIDGQDWLNTQPIDLLSLRGDVVLIVFWSFGCEASLLRLRQIEARVADPDVPIRAIAVHTPRFPYEEPADAVRAAIAQHHIRLPVVHDPEYTTWNAYNPEGWPATVVVNARGRVLGAQAGSHDIGLLDDTIELARRTIAAPVESSRAEDLPSPFPTGDGTVDRLPLPAR